MFYVIIYKSMPAPILHRDLWPDVGHLVHTIAARAGFTGSIFPTTLLVYHSAIYPQGMTFNTRVAETGFLLFISVNK